MIDAFCKLRLCLCTIDCRIGSPIDDDIRTMKIQDIHQGSRVGHITLVSAQRHHLPMREVMVQSRKKGSSQLATSPQQQDPHRDYRAPKPVKMVRMVLNTMSTSSQREKCLM
ncbi:hypothetical protein D3C80_1283850 [compost metagenome]